MIPLLRTPLAPIRLPAKSDSSELGDCCGFLVRMPDGTIWHPGETRVLDELLQVRDVDVLFFDASRARAHLGPEGSAQLAEACGAKLIIPYHYGTYDTKPGGPFNCDPEDFRHMVAGLPGRYLTVQPGEVIRLPLTA